MGTADTLRRPSFLSLNSKYLPTTSASTLQSIELPVPLPTLNSLLEDMSTPGPFSTPDCKQNQQSRSEAPHSSQHLKHVYSRYMRNPAVARWLLARYPGTDFLSVRAENSILITLSSASLPEVLPPSTPPACFPNLHDLFFLDHVDSNFALGYVWGKPGTETHPLASLPSRVNLTGWGKVVCRRFAACLDDDSARHHIEFAWLENDRLIVTINRSPAKPGSQLLSTCEIRYFGPTSPNTIPQTPIITTLILDSPFCELCSQHEKGKCNCTVAVHRREENVYHRQKRLNGQATACERESEIPSQLSASSESMTWEKHIRLLTMCNRRGILSTMYTVPNHTGQQVVRVRVRQAYSLSFGTQSAINERIHLNLKQIILCKSSPELSSLQPLKADWDQTWSKAHQELEEALKFQNQHPNLRKLPEPAKHAVESAEKETLRTRVNSPGRCFQLPSPATPGCALPVYEKSDHGARLAKSPQERDQKSSPENHERTSSNKESQDDANIGCYSISTGSIASLFLPALSRSRVNQKPGQSGFPFSAKAVPHSQHSLERVSSPFLSTILNSSKENATSSLADLAEMSSIIEPAPTTPRTPTTMFPTLTLPTGLEETEQPQNQERRSADLQLAKFASPAQSTFASRYTFAHRNGLNLLPSPMSMLLDFSDEPTKKRIRGSNAFDPASSGADDRWLSKRINERQKIRRKAGWQHSRESILERSQSGTIPEEAEEKLASSNDLSRSIQFPISSAHSQERIQVRTTRQNTVESPPVQVSCSKGGQRHVSENNTAAQSAACSGFGISGTPGSQDAKMNGCRENIQPPSTNSISPPEERQLAHDESYRVFSGNDAHNSDIRCDICHSTFSKRANLVRHTKTVHNSIKPFICETCGSKFGHKADLQRHMRNVHERKAFCCRTCGRSYVAQEQLNFHYRVTHEEDLRPFECGQCTMRFGRKSSLRRHEQTVHTDTRFKCSICQKSYSQRFDAIKHERKVHGAPRLLKSHKNVQT